MSDSRELQRHDSDLTPLSRSIQYALFLSNLTPEPVDVEALQAIAREEAAIVSEALPADSTAISPEAPEEGLVTLSAARNLLRKGSESPIYTHYRGEVHEGRPYGEDEDSDGGVPQYTFYGLREDGSRDVRNSVIGGVEVIEPWGFSVEELTVETQRQAELSKLRARFTEEHPLGEGGVLVTNRYGGIDPYDKEITQRSILTRFLIASRLGLKNQRPSFGDSQYVAHGLLDKRLEKILGESWYELGEAIEPSIALLKQVQAAGQDPTPIMPSVEELVRSHITGFLEEWAGGLVLAGHLLRNPKQSDAVVDALLSTDPGFKAVLREGAVDNHRKR
jgi:hypothetical protein